MEPKIGHSIIEILTILLLHHVIIYDNSYRWHDMHFIWFSMRDGFFSPWVSESHPSRLRRGKWWEFHLTWKTLQHAFSRILYTSRHVSYKLHCTQLKIVTNHWIWRHIYFNISVLIGIYISTLHVINWFQMYDGDSISGQTKRVDVRTKGPHSLFKMYIVLYIWIRYNVKFVNDKSPNYNVRCMHNHLAGGISTNVIYIYCSRNRSAPIMWNHKLIAINKQLRAVSRLQCVSAAWWFIAVYHCSGSYPSACQLFDGS